MKKAGLKLNIQKTKITASSPITSWQIDGENVETASDISFWAPKSIRLWLQPWNFKKRLFLGRIAMSSPDSVLKSRHHFANKGPYSQSYVFPSSRVWMWELGYKKSWALKHLHFWTMVLEKTLESPLDSKEISPEYSLEGLMLKLKLQYFGHLMWRADSLEKTLMLERLRAGGEGDSRGWDGWMASLAWWTWVCVDSGSWWWTGRPGMLWFMGSKRVGHDWVTELNWFYLGKMLHCLLHSIPFFPVKES